MSFSSSFIFVRHKCHILILSFPQVYKSSARDIKLSKLAISSDCKYELHLRRFSLDMDTSTFRNIKESYMMKKIRHFMYILCIDNFLFKKLSI